MSIRAEGSQRGHARLLKTWCKRELLCKRFNILKRSHLEVDHARELSSVSQRRKVAQEIRPSTTTQLSRKQILGLHGLEHASSYFLVLWQLDLHMRGPGDRRGFMTE